MGNTTPDDQLEFDLGAEEKETEISLEDDNEKENEASQASVEQEAPEAEEKQAQKDELDSVSEAVQKRIAKLTAKMREAERREQAALEYAKGLQSQAQELQQKLVSTDYSRLSETKTRLDTQQATLKAIIKKAREEGDIDTETEAQQRLADLGYEQRQVAAYLQQQEAAKERQVQQPQQAQQPQQVQQRPKPSPRAEQWAMDNPWFGQDRTLTYAAWGIHQTLIEDEGVDPNTEEYYTELDRRLRDEFPRRFASQQAEQPVARQQRPASAVAPASRSSGVASTRRSVRLSPSQVAIAKKLGVPLEEYAKYVKE
jgi:hypothetical protein